MVAMASDIPVTARGPLAAAAFALAMTPAAAGQLVLEELEATEGVGVVDRRGEALPLDAAFEDADGRPVTLGDFFDGERPVVIVPAYFDCPLLCTMVLDNVQDGLNGMSWTAGDEFRVITYSFDHRDTPSDARVERDLALAGYKVAVEEPREAWAFLTTDAATAKRVSAALGYHYKFLPDIGEYSHNAAIFFASPDGELSNFIEGLEYPPQRLKLAISQAAAGDVGSLFDRVALACFRYDPKTGEWVIHPFNVMRVVASGTAAALGLLIAALFVAERVRRTRVRAAGAGAEESA
jgi:protein SCO1/2